MHERVRSRLFHSAGTFVKEFNEHLAIVWGYTPEQRKVILKHLPALVSAVTEREQMVARERFVAEVGGDPQKAVKALQVVNAIANIWSPFRDTAAVALEDIQGLDVLPTNPKQRKDAISFCKSLFEFLSKDSDRRLRRAAAGAALRNLINLYATIDCRLVVDSEFDWRSDDPAKYKPSCRGTVPVAILSLKLDEGDLITFQCDRSDLEMLVRRLQATIKELNLAGIACKKAH